MTATATRRDITITELKTTKDRHVVQVKVSFQKGGTSFLSGHHYPGGYYLSAGPIERTDGGYRFLIGDGSGIKVLLEPSDRFNAKRLKLWADKANGHPAFRQAVDHVVATNKDADGDPIVLADSQPQGV